METFNYRETYKQILEYIAWNGYVREDKLHNLRAIPFTPNHDIIDFCENVFYSFHDKGILSSAEDELEVEYYEIEDIDRFLLKVKCILGKETYRKILYSRNQDLLIRLSLIQKEISKITDLFYDQ